METKLTVAGAGAARIGDLSLKLAEAALIAHQRGDKVEAAFFSIKAAETLQLAKVLGWKLPAPEPALSRKEG